MKRLARGGDGVARQLYRAGAYGSSLRVVLTGGTVVLAGLALLVLVQSLGILLGIGLLLLVLAVGLVVFVPADELTHSSLWLAKRSAPGLAWVLYRLHPLLDLVVRIMRRFRHVSIHTGLYEKSDLARLLERQRDQPDSRISTTEVDLLLHSLSFGDRKVSDAMVPKRVVKTVAATEHIGPVLMDELNRSGHSRFPVYDQKHDNIVGVLFLRKLVAGKQSGIVADVMSHELTYVHEDFTLLHTLQAFLRTKQHLFLVVNSFEELVGVITIEDVLEQMIGRQIVDEFDHYDDLRSVAATAAKKDHKEHREPKSESA
jgi:CBS domain containing-hemolysin-like protein